MPKPSFKRPRKGEGPKGLRERRRLAIQRILEREFSPIEDGVLIPDILEIIAAHIFK